MEKEFWLTAWNEGRTRFHRDAFNSNLVKFLPSFKINANSEVLVPLCGKTLDLIYLSNAGHKVTGVEFSEIAAKSFFEENKLDYTIDISEKFKIFKSGNITILNGSLFDLDKNLKFDFVYDRASIVALPLELREKYYTNISNHLNKNAKILMITLDYQQDLIQGPPFSVSDSEISKHLSEKFSVELINSELVKGINPKFEAAGLDSIKENVYSFTFSG